MNLLAPLYRFADLLRYRNHRNIGSRGEDLAHRYLRRRGFVITARNWRPPQGGGEIDIVARDGEYLVFVEVKTRASDKWNAPERDIDDDKMRALRRAARDYVRRSGADPALVRFDVIAIAADKLNYLADAFRFRADPSL